MLDIKQKENDTSIRWVFRPNVRSFGFFFLVFSYFIFTLMFVRSALVCTGHSTGKDDVIFVFILKYMVKGKKRENKKPPIKQCFQISFILS